MKKQTRDYIAAAAGLLLLAAGLYLIKTGAPLGALRALPYLLVGAGCGVFGYGAGNILGRSALKNSPEAAKQLEIDAGDERNIAIANRAKAKAYDMMLNVYGALMFALALMDTPMSVILLLVAAYLLIAGCCVYYRAKYDKEM